MKIVYKKMCNLTPFQKKKKLVRQIKEINKIENITRSKLNCFFFDKMKYNKF
jgi:hypothetical protein